MTILYAIDETADLDHAACTANLLAQRADVHVVIDAADPTVEEALRARLDALPRIRCSAAPPVSPAPLAYLAERLMSALDAPSPPRFAAAMRWAERAIPTAPECDAFLATEQPDVLVTAPLPAPGSMRADLIRSARARGIPHLRHGDRSSASAEQIAAAIDRLTGDPPARRVVVRAGVAARLAGPILVRVAARLAATADGQRAREARVSRVRHSREVASSARKAGSIAARESAHGERARARQQRTAHRDAVRRARAAEEAAAEAGRAAALAVSREQFVQVRAWASRWRTSGAGATSAAEHQLAQDLAPLWNADPDAVATLRHWSAAITGDRPEHYSVPVPNPDGDGGVSSWQREFYGRQKELGPALMVSDPEVLGGGFGWIRNEIRYNADTLRYMHAAGALSDGAVLPAFRQAGTRQVVWDIGGGWGGFAHYFKTLCPNVTYLVTAPPEVLLVSATFLQAAFPAARCHFHESGAAPWGDPDVDFIFAPEGALDDLQPPRLDLTLDLGALPRMTAERRSAHVRRSFEWGARFFYSMLPPGTLAGGDAAVREAIERYFWPHPVAPRPVSHDARARGEGIPRYTHLVGWRRIRV